MPLKTITDYMKRLGFTPQKPIKSAYKKNTKKWFKENFPNIKKKIKIFYSPSYSLELNSYERLNRDLKTHFHSRPISKNEKEFGKKITNYLRSMQKITNRIKNCFNSKVVKYPA